MRWWSTKHCRASKEEKCGVDSQTVTGPSMWPCHKLLTSSFNGNTWISEPACDRAGCVVALPVEHLSHFGEAAERKQHQDGFGLVVDLRGAEVLGPALQHVGALGRAQAHLGERKWRQTHVMCKGLKLWRGTLEKA